MSSPAKSNNKSIKDVSLTAGHVWIHGNVKKFEGDRVEIEDGTGTLAMDILRSGNDDEGTSPTVIQGNLAPGAMLRVIGDVVADISGGFTLSPMIIQNLDELGVDKALFSKIRSLEQQIAGDK